jgi:23S rRNA pseudouridine1911/1915/1917 synthase
MAAMKDDQDAAASGRSWVVTPETASMRLDAFTRRCLPHLSRRAIARAIRQHEFWINGRPADKGAKMAARDVVTFHGPVTSLYESPPPAEGLALPIVYEDASLLIIDKPAGIATHGFSGADSDTVANFIAAARPQILTVGRNRWEPGLVHRLDRGTSGLLLVAKTQAAFDCLRAQFRAREIRKSYRALVWGKAPAEGSIRYPLAHDSKDPARMIAVTGSSPGKDGQKTWQALTRFRTLSASDRLSFLAVEMESGVMHQIRAHLAAIGHPIVADPVYGLSNVETFGLERHFLHACGLEFTHPVQPGKVNIQSRLPPDLEAVLVGLGLIQNSGSAN